jgi:hypothetical protein
MGKVYDPPKGFNPPDIRLASKIGFPEYQKLCEAFVDSVKRVAREQGDCPEAGKEINFPVGDGRARYVIFSLKPVKLVHLSVNDGYHFQYVHRLTAADIREELRKQNGLKKLFSSKKKAA